MVQPQPASTLDITITPVNDAPVANPNTATGAEDSVVTGDGPEADDTDIDGDALTVVDFTVMRALPEPLWPDQPPPFQRLVQLVINTDGTIHLLPRCQLQRFCTAGILHHHRWLH